MQLAHLASRLYGTPLLIARPKLEVILATLGPRIGLPEVMNNATALPVQRAVAQSKYPGIAVIPIHGTLVRRTLGLEAASGLMSYAEITNTLEVALSDPKVKGILLDIDSPGGEAGGVFELAKRIRAVSAIKPVWAHANDSAYSAAYVIAAAASRVTLSQTAGVGSIGVIALHVDQSVRDAKEGLHYTAIYAGHHKNDFSPHEPLSPQANTALQTEVNRLYQIFVDHVSALRRMPVDAVRSSEAGLYFGDEAVSLGLADAVNSFDEALTSLSEFIAANQKIISGNPSKLSAQTITSNRNAFNSNQLKGTPPMNEAERTDDSQSEPADTQVLVESDSPDLAAEAQAQQINATVHPTVEAAHAPPNWRAEAQAIAELCLIAGSPERTAEFLAANMSQAQIRQVLLNDRAEQPEITSRITADAGVRQQPEDSPIVAAAKKLSAKE